MPYLMSIDPGEATGVALAHYGEDAPYSVIRHWLVPGGVSGFLAWHRGNQIVADCTVVSEKFILSGGNNFAANTEALRIEGAMLGLRMSPIFQQRSDKSLVDDQVLKDHGLWVTGKDVGWEDGRDVNDAIIHGLVYLRRIRHLPTIRKYWPPK